MATYATQEAGPSESDDENGSLQVLCQELRQLQAKQRKLKRQVEKHRLFEDYLLSVLDKLSTGCRARREFKVAQVDVMVEHYSKLFSAVQDAQWHLEIFSQMKQAVHQNLEALVEGHRDLVPHLKIRLCQLQKRCYHKKWQPKLLGPNVPFQMDSSFDIQSPDERYDSLLFSYMQLTIDSMAQQCCSKAAHLPKRMGLLPKLDLIKKFILDKMETMRIVSLLLEPRGCCSGDSLKGRRHRQCPSPLKKSPRNPVVIPRTPFPSTQTSEWSSVC